MDIKIAKVHKIDAQIEDTLRSLEMKDDFKKALVKYQQAEKALNALEITSADPAYSEQQRVLGYVLMRQSNLVRLEGELGKALSIDERGLKAARASEDEITISRCLMSYGTNCILSGDITKGLDYIEQAHLIFESGTSYDHRQGLGWYWLLQADLANAGLIEMTPNEILKCADHAFKILIAIENWPGVARGYAAKAQVYERLGNEKEADDNRENQQYYEGLVDTNKPKD